jgi:hypothetical protein
VLALFHVDVNLEHQFSFSLGVHGRRATRRDVTICCVITKTVPTEIEIFRILTISSRARQVATREEGNRLVADAPLLVRRSLV